MKCEIIRDLLPAYCDGVCSEESAREIKAHIEGCGGCKKLLSELGSEVNASETGKSSPEKPFKKLRGKLRRSKAISLIILFLLIIVLSVTGYLSYGQMIRKHGYQSFETLFAAYNAKKLLNEYCSGNMDNVDKIIVWQDDSLFEYKTEIQEYAEKELIGFYKDYIEGNDVTVTVDGYGYYSYGMSDVTTAACEVFIQGEKLPAIAMSVWQTELGYSVNPYPYNMDERWENDEYKELKGRVYQLRNALYAYPPLSVLEESLFTKKESRDRAYDFVCDNYSDGVDEGYSAKLYDRINALMDTGIVCEDFSCTNYMFDSENERYLIDIVITFSEPSTGKRAVYTRTAQVGNSDNRYVFLPEFEPLIIDEGIDPDIRTQIEKLF